MAEKTAEWIDKKMNLNDLALNEEVSFSFSHTLSLKTTHWLRET